MTDWRYRLYGLEVASALDLGPLPSGDPALPVQVQVCEATTFSHHDLTVPPGHWMAGDAEGVLLDLGQGGRFCVTGGERIEVDAATVSSAALRWRLLGLAFGAVLHQRGTLPLHSTVIGLSPACQTEGVCLVGASGAGKSTLAAALGQAGHRLLIDDVCATSADQHGIWAEAGNGLTRLWSDAMEALTIDGGEQLDPELEKFELPVARPHDGKVRLRALVAITDGDQLDMVPLDPAERLQLCLTSTYARAMLDFTGGASRNFLQCAGIAQELPAYRLVRPRRFDAMAETVKCVRRTLDALA